MPVEELPDPPAPPSLPRRIRLYRYQWVGLGLIVALPVLALAGVFGESWRSEEARGADVEAAVTWPERFRYKQVNSIEVRVRNTSSRVLDTMTVALDTALAGRFSTVRAIPSFTRPYETDLTDLRPGETSLVLVEIQAERYGRHEGTLSVIHRDTVRIPISIRIFP